MLVIQTDIFKSIWFFLYPTVALAHGPVPSTSPFCQISGFFLTAAIEACDIAIVLIAIHTALYIVRGNDGLFPYRKFAYGIFVLLPLALAGLAFVDRPAFTNSGEFCYLPTKADWTGRALSWIPRYIIFVTLLLNYTCIYLYVAFILNRSGAAGSGRPDSLSVSAGRDSNRRTRRSSLPPTPPIAYHGLIDSTPPPTRPSTPEEERRTSSWTVPIFSKRLRKASRTSNHTPSPAEPGSQGVKWNLPAFGLDSANSSGDPELSARRTGNQPRRRSVPSISPVVSSPTSTRSFWHRSLAATRPQSRAPSQPNILAVLRQGPDDRSVSSASIFLTNTALEETGMSEKRDKVLQHTRQLFLYPIAYLIVWFFPLLAHILGGEDRGAPFAIVLLGLLSMCLHGACDAMVFCWKEQPWRHVGASGVEDAFSIWIPGPSAGANPNVGRTQEEMMLDRKTARKRRETETAELRLGRMIGPGNSADWWDRMQQEAESSERSAAARR